MILLLQSILERVYGAFLVYGVFIAVVIYFIRKQIKKPDKDPLKVIVKWTVSLMVLTFMGFSALTAKGLSFLIVFIVIILPGSILLGLWWTPAISEWMASPITNALTGDSRLSYNKPEYGVANARRNRGQYLEAVEAVNEELAKHPGNFDGLMLKASIQAENLGDLESATETVQEAIECVAGDPGAARRTLRQIREALPESQAAQFAAQRLASLDSSEETEAAVVDFNESYQKLVEESAGNDDFTSPLELPKAIETNQQQAGDKSLANYLRRVALHPDSVGNREELAALYLGHANQPVKAAEQYEHLLALPGTTIHQKAAWLNRIADIQVKNGESHETVRATLERVVALDPKAAPAVRAQQRISYLNIELRGAKHNSTKLQLGNYEQDIGLKN